MRELKTMAVIRVPKTPKSAFNKNRPVSELLRRQVEHLEYLQSATAAAPRLQSVPRLRSKGTMTEGQAAAYIEAMTRRLHPEAAQPVPATESAPSPVTRPATPPSKAKARAKGKTKTKPERIVRRRSASRRRSR
ncbi:MAG: hypothetical protein C5B57_03860 [Blastocatellia bacterium]|nr:MAG: hypothetical protein C5B57_03860 [Blastocatellia bacterium]